MSSARMKVLVFLGSVRDGRLAPRVGKFVSNLLEKNSFEVTILDPKELGLGQVTQPLHFYRDPSQAPEILHKLNKQIQEADGFVAVGAEYNSAISPSLSSLMDHFPPLSYAYRPSAIVTYSPGQFGGIRAAMQLRQYLSELQTVHMSNMVCIGKVHEVLNENGELIGEQTQLMKAAQAMMKQFEWYSNALKNHKKAAGLPQ